MRKATLASDVEFLCPVCGYSTIIHSQARDHWQMHQKDPAELRELITKLAETKEGGK